MNYPSLSQSLTVDVAIVGGGITGLTTALLLKQAGLSVAVLEAFQIGSGVSGFTTAHISEVPDIGYETLVAHFGESDARLVVESRRAAIAKISKVIEHYGIDCDFELVSSYLYTEAAHDVPRLEAELTTAQRLGVTASHTTTVPLPFSTLTGILFPDQAQFDPLRYLQAIAHIVNGQGSFVFEQSRVLDISGSSPYTLQTAKGAIGAQQVVLATHTPIHDLTNLQDLYLLTTKMAAYRSYVIGLRLRHPAPQGLFWDTAEPYHYTRRSVTADGRELLILGGEDHKTGESVDTIDRYRRLEDYARSRYAIEAIDYRWSAQLYEPVDGLPFIGKAFLHDDVYIATGFSGNGMSFGTVAAMLLADQITGRFNPWSQLYDPGRIQPFAAPQEFIALNLEVAQHFIRDRFRSDVSEVVDVPRSEGRIVQVEGQQRAVYRDEQGQIHTLSPVCTHAGCIVNWNNAEKSWDCPCHGGRFSGTGQVLNGPPIRNLDNQSLT